jgi:hypothetical protein
LAGGRQRTLGIERTAGRLGVADDVQTHPATITARRTWGRGCGPTCGASTT